MSKQSLKTLFVSNFDDILVNIINCKLRKYGNHYWRHRSLTFDPVHILTINNFVLHKAMLTKFAMITLYMFNFFLQRSTVHTIMEKSVPHIRFSSPKAMDVHRPPQEPTPDYMNAPRPSVLKVHVQSISRGHCFFCGNNKN